MACNVLLIKYMHTLIIYKENLNMANGTLKILPDSQKTYCKYAYTYGGTTYSDIHTFTTGGRTSQSIAPAISTSKVSLSELNPASVSANKVIAKTNACMYEYGINQFYGFFIDQIGPTCSLQPIRPVLHNDDFQT